ncbi:MurR/RpiR family transcriptional regulator [Breznakia pachnodae]|uniref:DNA-binding MurR/RpiR family transcriptional regulator n=1 Tax=Breznakia pachnodae TaxID=265178 RepID=A0ABU0E823_9FIRM|nr:MurR/RpiR family transcriptional regulator [Breznakia pachnodae]MDQ0363037.1 DNA-binding MurR/RpiR family transcriptional regulator [Breznakia pachnodae]
MAMHSSVLSSLLRYINNTKKRDTNYSIAKEMLMHFDDIPNVTIHEMADFCYVSSASISRFVKMLGYENYVDFKKQCKDSIAINVDYSKEVAFAGKKEMKPIFESYTNNIIGNLDFTLENLDYQQLERICELIYQSQDVCFLGLEYASLIGQHFQIKMAELNKLIKIGNTYNDHLEIVNSLNNNSVVFIASLEGGYFYRNDDIIQIIKQKKCKVITLTMNHELKPMKEVDEVLLCSKNNSNTEGRIALLYIIELIIMYYYVNYKAAIS